MDILFINPPWTVENKDNLWKNVRSCFPSLGIAYMASFLEKHGKLVKILDCTAEEISLNEIRSVLKKYDKPEFIGITSTTPTIVNALNIAEICKKEFSRVKVVLGGVHPTVLPGEVLENKWVDYVVRDEGEVTIKELVEGKNPGDIPGLSYKAGKDIIHNASRPLIKDLDELPIPAYHLLPIEKYHPAVGAYKRLPAMSLFTTRGCPGRCTFCYKTFYGKVRLRSAKNIIEEIKLLQNNYGIEEIAFYDDAFTVSKKRVKELCCLLKEEKIDVAWTCFSISKHIDEQCLILMKESGCHLILFGVESADDQILKNINKNISLEQVKETIRLCRKIGIETRTSFMFGNPGETEETIKRTINFAIEMDSDEAQFNIVTAYPGTELFSWAEEKGCLLTKDWSKYNMSEINIIVPTLDERILKKYYKLSHRKFYLRPKIILRRLRKIRNVLQLKQEIKGLFAILCFLFSPKPVKESQEAIMPGEGKQDKTGRRTTGSG